MSIFLAVMFGVLIGYVLRCWQENHPNWERKS